MNNKINVIVISFLFHLILISVNASFIDEVIDQSTPFGYDGWACGAWNTYIAQSFKPKLPVLSKVEIGLFKMDNANGNVTVSIRNSLNGEDLTSKTLSIDIIPLPSDADWVEFDFEDIEVTPDNRYYIVFTMNDGERPDKVVLWVHSIWNPYWRGRPWQYTIQGFWLPTFMIMTKFPDTSFRTYGYN
jgi:hypothetical protein